MSEITVGEAHARWSAGELNIVDVREPNEHEATRVEGIPLIPMGEVIERIDELPGEPLAVLCRSGNRRFNPIFIEGDKGLGKTHLLNAVGNTYRTIADGKAAYLNCGDHVVLESLMQSVLHEVIWQFLDSVKVLLVDDVHLLPPGQSPEVPA